MCTTPCTKGKVQISAPFFPIINLSLINQVNNNKIGIYVNSNADNYLNFSRNVSVAVNNYKFIWLALSVN
jgi:hypothetical protein